MATVVRMKNDFVNKFEERAWHSAPVSETPLVVLVGWHVFEVKLPDRTERTRHFAGTTAREGHGKVSTPIVEFDPATWRGVTESGRVYQLENSAGLDINVTLAWDAWIRVHAATDLVDVTAEIKELALRRLDAPSLAAQGFCASPRQGQLTS